MTPLKLTKSDIEVLEFFANQKTIDRQSPNQVILTGNVITHFSDSGYAASYQSQTEFTKAIYMFDAKVFGPSLAKMTDPLLTVDEKFVNITFGKSSWKIPQSDPYCMEDTVAFANVQKIDLSYLLENEKLFGIDHDQYQEIKNASRIIPASDTNIIEFFSENNAVYVHIYNGDDEDEGPSVKIEIGETYHSFSYKLRLSQFNLMFDKYNHDDYTVRVGMNRHDNVLMEFKSNSDLTIWIAVMDDGV